MNIESQKKSGFESETLDQAAESVIAMINSKTSNGVLGFSWELKHNDNISNSHHAPLNGVTNWSRRDPGNPTGYPGWEGRVWIRYKNSPKSFGSDPFNGTRTHTGTGGFGSYDGPWAKVASKRYLVYGHKKNADFPEIQCYSWDYRIFESDWPEIALAYQGEKMWARLGGPASTLERHFYLFEDADTKKKDELFVNSVRATKTV